MKNVQVDNRKSALVLLSEYCINSMGVREEKGDYLEVTEWANGEGYDINIYDKTGDRYILLTSGQYDALKACVKAINKSYKEE